MPEFSLRKVHPPQEVLEAEVVAQGCILVLIFGMSGASGGGAMPRTFVLSTLTCSIERMVAHAAATASAASN